MRSVLVTGGAGFVGSHVVRAAHDAGWRVVVIDDLSAGPLPPLPGDVHFVRGDIADRELVSDLLDGIDAIVHCAGKISVAESIANPELYFEANVKKSMLLLDTIARVGLRPFVFSSSAAVYGVPTSVGCVETAPRAPINPYGENKVAVEQLLERATDRTNAGRTLSWAALRYFNAAGAHPDGTLRESHEPETHLIPLAIDARADKPLAIYGDDYDTPDGTCIRDFVHVCDLADAHLAAIDALLAGTQLGAVNLGSGSGSSVMQVIDTCARVLGRPVPHVIAPRREGDAPVLVAAIDRARDVLGWRPTRTLDVIIEDAVRARRSPQR